MSYAERGDPGCGDGFEDTDYARVGIDVEQARGWRRWGIEPIDAARWLQAGVDDEVEAARWGSAVAPPDVAGLREAGMTSELLARWREHGATTEEALREHAKGTSPEDFSANAQRSMTRHSMLAFRGRRAGVLSKQVSENKPEPTPTSDERMRAFGVVFSSYDALDWTDDEGLSYARQGIDVLDARDWKALGLTAAEAAEQEQQGRGPIDLVLVWSRAGFGPYELASWIGAGLTLEEAAAQKADGVTVEQAAVLRSLRRHETE